MSGDTPAPVDFRLLGPLEVMVDGAPAALGPPKQRALLVALATRAGEAVPVERLVDELWPEEPPASARHAVQVYVSRLRRALGDPRRIVARSRAYALHMEPGELDLERFRALVGEGRTLLAEQPGAAGERLREALALWRGRALADLDGEPGVRDLVPELEEERLAALELRIEAELAAGADTALVPELEGLLAEHPAREALYADLMLALYRSGRQADALAVYRRARDALLHELGLEPSAQLKALEQAILRQDPALTVESPELRARRHLPAQPNAFIGRENELDELVQLVGAGGIRLVTLTGAGGIGKTRLALAAGERLAASFADGVWFVDLAPLSDPALVPSAIVQALGIAEQPGKLLATTLAEHLREHELLLLLDNFEHVLGATPTVSALLKQAPRLKLLVTSRAPLELYGEHEYEVPSLELPDLDQKVEPEALERSEAAALFLERARAVRRHFALDQESTRIVAETCVRLDGLPLALELAAARLRTLAPSELLAGLARRLETLTQAPRDVPERHRTMRTAIEWSYELLDEEEQELFARLAVFAGGSTPEAAREVCDASPKALDSLFEKNVIRRRDTELGPRYWMLETLREYAAEKLEQRHTARDVRQRHAEYMVAFAENAAEEHERSAAGWLWFASVEAEQNNLRAALAFAEETEQTDLQLELIGKVWRYWYVRGLFLEGRRWTESALARTEGERSARRSNVLAAASAFASDVGDLAEAEACAEECLALRRELGDLRSTAEALGGVAYVAALRGDLVKAARVHEEAAVVAREGGSRLELARALGNLGDTVLQQGDIARAMALTEEALAHFRELGSDWGCKWMLLNRAYCLLQTGRDEECLLALREGRELSPFGEDIKHLLDGAAVIAAVALRRGRSEAAAELIEAAEALCRHTGTSPTGVARALHDSTKEQLLATLGRERYDAASAAARAMSLERATQYILDAA